MNIQPSSSFIRLAKKGENISKDLVEISENSYQYGSPWKKADFERILVQDHVFMLLVEINKHIVGFLCGGVTPFEAEIYNIAIRQDYKRRGFATLLMNEMNRMTASNQIDETFLEVRKSNVEAIKLYKKMGFEPVGIRKNYYINPTEHALILKCTEESKTGGH